MQADNSCTQIGTIMSATHERQFFHQLKILKNNFYIHIYPETKYFVMTKRF